MEFQNYSFKRSDINYALAELFPGRVLVDVLLKKLIRNRINKIRNAIGLRRKPDYGFERAVVYNGLVVFDKPELDGEGPRIGPDYIRALLELGFQKCERIFEFCSGPGYIGYNLLAYGFCEKLTLADINPEAVAVAKKTATYNKIEHLVNIYHSDCFDQIPNSERWDIVVGNPPHFQLDFKLGNTARGRFNLKAHDPDWRLHRRFYSGVNKYMKPGGHVVIMENTQGGQTEDTFKPMIREGGGELVSWNPSIDICGRKNPMCYIVSRW